MRERGRGETEVRAERGRERGREREREGEEERDVIGSGWLGEHNGQKVIAAPISLDPTDRPPRGGVGGHQPLLLLDRPRSATSTP